MNTQAELAAAKRRINDLENRLAKIEGRFQVEEKPIAELPAWPGPPRNYQGLVMLADDAQSYEDRMATDRRERQAAFDAEQARRTEGLPAGFGLWRDPYGLPRHADGRQVLDVEMNQMLAEVAAAEARKA